MQSTVLASAVSRQRIILRRLLSETPPLTFSERVSRTMFGRLRGKLLEAILITLGILTLTAAVLFVFLGPSALLNIATQPSPQAAAVKCLKPLG
jgi:hypothetical protein